MVPSQAVMAHSDRAVRLVQDYPISPRQAVLLHRHRPLWSSPESDGWRPYAFSRSRLRSCEVSSFAGQGSARSREELRAYDDLMAMFIAIIINSLDETKRGNLQEGLEPVSRQDLVRELRATQETLKRLEERLNADDAEEEDRR